MLIRLILSLIAAIFIIKFFQYLLKNSSKQKKYNDVVSKQKKVNMKDVRDAEFEEIEDE
tara:strand:+ start:4539 stop:4715 length:177 start_codon:yes stop_codon:yes gene_type:complete